MTIVDEGVDVSGIERAIAGAMSKCRHPKYRDKKGRKKSTPGQMYLRGGSKPVSLARRLCNNKFNNSIRYLPKLTGEKDLYDQIRVVEVVLVDILRRKELQYIDGSWRVSDQFLDRQQQLSEHMRIVHGRSVARAKEKNGYKRSPQRKV